jgi:multimeric flavodoxin WrbA
MLSLSPQGLIYDAIIFAVVVYICSIQKILKDIIDREIYARVSSIPNLSSFKSHREIIKAFENLP